MITNGKFYTGITGDTQEGNGYYSPELKKCIEEAGNICLETIKSNRYSPCMLLGSIQSGKTRGFIGLMALCFDNDFDMTIILTKCSKALVQQTVKRMSKQFDDFKSENATVGEVIAQDIMDMDFSSATDDEMRESIAFTFLNKYRRKKRILIVKKEANNVDRMNIFIKQLVKSSYYKRVLIVDDEADVTSIGYENNREIQELTLRRISGAINTARVRLKSRIEYAVIQITATPYALYLQPDSFDNPEIMPVKPRRTVVMPTGKGYIGGKYYFMDSQDVDSPNYDKAKFIPHTVDDEEMDIINGSGKNSSKNAKINDGRTIRWDDFTKGQSEKSTFALPSLRDWIFDVLVGAAIIQLNPGYEDYYVSAVMHADTKKSMHKSQIDLIKNGLDIIKETLEEDIDDPDVGYFIEESYKDLIDSVKAYGVLDLPPFKKVKQKIASIESGELEGLISEIDLKEVNSDSDIIKLLNDDGELRLESSITIFVGGQVLDRGITIPNMLNFYYGRNPKTMQQDTVIQHCRMFGYRIPELLSVTRFYTTKHLFYQMREITIRDELLRERIVNNSKSEVVYIETGDHIRPCSQAKILASDLNSIMPQKRYLPVGFDIRTGKREAEKAHDEISDIISENKGFLSEERSRFRKGDDTSGKYVLITPETAHKLLELSYSILDPSDDGFYNTFKQIEPAFIFSISGMSEARANKIALVVRKYRSISKYKKYGNLYQDAPDDGNNEGALANELRKEMPVLILTEQTNSDWKYRFWWPVFYTPDDMNIGIYAEERSKKRVEENLRSIPPRPVIISSFKVYDSIGLEEGAYNDLAGFAERISKFHDSEFLFAGDGIDTLNRRGMECPIYIEDLNPASSDENVKAKIGSLKEKALHILADSKVPEEDIGVLAGYFDAVLDGADFKYISDEVFGFVKQLGLSKYAENNLKGILEYVNDLIYRKNEPFGLFIPIAYNRVEIHVYKGTIEYYLDSFGENNEENVRAFMIATMAHEMFHAYHFADTITMSGKWLYTRKGFIDQVITQESMAEYFSLSYCKQIKDKSISDRATKIIRDMRDVSNFPDDPYPGALLFESKDQPNCGNGNREFAKAYEASLFDIYKSCAVILGMME